MTAKNNQLYANYVAVKNDFDHNISQVLLKPTEETIDYLTLAYRELKRPPYENVYQERQEAFILPLNWWKRWLTDELEGNISFLRIDAQLPDFQGVKNPACTNLSLQASTDLYDTVAVFYGSDYLHELTHTYQLANLIKKEPIIYNDDKDRLFINMHLLEMITQTLAISEWPYELQEKIASRRPLPFMVEGTSFNQLNLIQHFNTSQQVHLILLYTEELKNREWKRNQ